MRTATRLGNARGNGPGDAFLEGRVGMVTYGHWRVPDSKKNARFSWNIAPLPHLTRSGSTMNSLCFSAFKDTRQLGLATGLIAYAAASPEVQTEVIKLGVGIPGLKSVAQSPAYLQSNGPLRTQVFLDALPVGRMGPRSAGYADLEAAWTSGLERLWTGQAASKEVPTDVTAKLRAVLAKNPPIA